MEFIEAPAFTKFVKLYLQDDEYAELQRQLEKEPDAGDLIPGTGGLRKLRWHDRRRSKGKRGGLRLIYYHFTSDYQVWLLTIYDKNEAADLTTSEKKVLRNVLELELAARKIKRAAGRRSGR